MDLCILNPKDKLKLIRQLGILPEQSIVIGDGYTDIPLLERAKVPVLIDRTGKIKDKYIHRHFYFISSVSELDKLIQNEFYLNFEANTKKYETKKCHRF